MPRARPAADRNAPDPGGAGRPERPRTVRDVLARGREYLQRNAVEAARLESELLVAHALGTDRLRLFLDLDRPVDEGEIARSRELLVRRGKGEPCAYVVGKKEFYGRDFEVGPDVLIPRPETELLVDLARRVAESLDEPRIGELGTGSGCLAVTLFLELPGAHVVATDSSARALDVARRNATRLGAEVELVLGDGLLPLRGRGPFDLFLSNPPYVDPGDPETDGALDPAVRAFEPHEALFAPPGDPDHWVRTLVGAAGELLLPGGVLLVELGYDQADRVRDWLDGRAGVPTFHADLAGVERVLQLTRPSGARGMTC